MALCHEPFFRFFTSPILKWDPFGNFIRLTLDLHLWSPPYSHGEFQYGISRKTKRQIQDQFSFKGRRYSRSLKTDNESKAKLAKSQVERNLELVSLGLLEHPGEGDFVEFLLTGKQKTLKELPSANVKPNVKSESPALELILQLYFDEFPEDSIEKCTLDMLKTHRKNIERLIGKTVRLTAINASTLQNYLDKRAKEKGRHGNIKPATLRKEITTLYSIFDGQ